MARISLVEQYNNKDVISQIYDLKDTVGDFDGDIADASAKADTAYSMASSVTAVAENALTAAQGASSTAQTAQAKADEAAAQAKTAKQTADVSLADAAIQVTATTGTLAMAQNDGGQKSTAIPIASSEQAGFMNAQTYNSITSMDSRISALENKQSVVYVSFPTTTPTQDQITSSFKNASGRVPVKGDIAQDIAKALIYQYDGSTWIQTQGGAAAWTNTTAGLVKGSASGAGTVFAESDGTGSVNGWDDMQASVDTNASNITVNANAIKTVDGRVDEANTAISKNASDITAMGTRVSTLETTVKTIPKIQQATVVLNASSWSSSALTQTVSCSIVTSSNIVWVAPAGSIVSYGKNGVYASAQGDGTLTFTCTSVPQDTYTVNIVTADI
jgi:hypothetical protein